MSDCDMCMGTGKTQTLVNKDTGEQIYYTTQAKTDVEYEAQGLWEEENTVTKDIDCRTCKGSGVLPEYLKLEYWK